jgi:hypothetical protein
MIIPNKKKTFLKKGKEKIKKKNNYMIKCLNLLSIFQFLIKFGIQK